MGPIGTAPRTTEGGDPASQHQIVGFSNGIAWRTMVSARLSVLMHRHLADFVARRTNRFSGNCPESLLHLDDINGVTFEEHGARVTRRLE